MTNRKFPPATPASRLRNGLCCHQRVVYARTPFALFQLKEAQA